MRVRFVSNDVRRHRLISISYLSLLPCHGKARWYGREGESIGGNRKESDDCQICGGVVQLVRTAVTQEAAGSSPVAPAKCSTEHLYLLSKRVGAALLPHCRPSSIWLGVARTDIKTDTPGSGRPPLRSRAAKDDSWRPQGNLSHTPDQEFNRRRTKPASSLANPYLTSSS